jgi:hypothetical protein
MGPRASAGLGEEEKMSVGKEMMTATVDQTNNSPSI